MDNNMLRLNDIWKKQSSLLNDIKALVLQRHNLNSSTASNVDQEVFIHESDYEDSFPEPTPLDYLKSLEDYYVAFETWVDRANVPPAQKLTFFLKGLLPELQQKVRRYNPWSYKDAYAFAMTQAVPPRSSSNPVRHIEECKSRHAANNDIASHGYFRHDQQNQLLKHLEENKKIDNDNHIAVKDVTRGNTTQEAQTNVVSKTTIEDSSVSVENIETKPCSQINRRSENITKDLGSGHTSVLQQAAKTEIGIVATISVKDYYIIKNLLAEAIDAVTLEDEENAENTLYIVAWDTSKDIIFRESEPADFTKIPEPPPSNMLSAEFSVLLEKSKGGSQVAFFAKKGGDNLRFLNSYSEKPPVVYTPTDRRALDLRDNQRSYSSVWIESLQFQGSAYGNDRPILPSEETSVKFRYGEKPPDVELPTDGRELDLRDSRHLSAAPGLFSETHTDDSWNRRRSPVAYRLSPLVDKLALDREEL